MKHSSQPGIAGTGETPVSPMRVWALILAALAICGVARQAAAAESKSAAEDEYYKILSFTPPDDVVLECGGFEMMPDGKLAVATRRGDIYAVANAFNADPKNATYTLWASGLHEVLGLAWRDGWLYAVQRGEVSRLKDTDNDGRADLFETFCDDWGISGDYHEYAMGSKFDQGGNLYVALCLTGSFTSEAPFRGWCLKITPEGKSVPFASGIRSPGGIGFNHLGELFSTDNQGPWNGTSSLKQLLPGSFMGHPIGFKWFPQAEKKGMAPPPQEPKSGSRFHIEAAKIPQYIPPVCLLPHEKVGQSASGFDYDHTDGKFGPFKNHLFVGDQHHSNLTRVVLDKVGERYNSVAIPFRSGFASGVVPVMQAPDGSFIIGGTNRGWGSVGPKEYALERLVWTGKTPFELLDMKATPDGFDLTFTEPVDKAKAADVNSYAMRTWTYIFQSEYGSPEVDKSKSTIKSATVSDDGLHVRLVVDGLEVGHVHELKLDGVRSAGKAAPLLHPIAYYTLWSIPK